MQKAYSSILTTSYYIIFDAAVNTILFITASISNKAEARRSRRLHIGAKQVPSLPT